MHYKAFRLFKPHPKDDSIKHCWIIQICDKSTLYIFKPKRDQQIANNHKFSEASWYKRMLYAVEPCFKWILLVLKNIVPTLYKQADWQICYHTIARDAFWRHRWLCWRKQKHSKHKQLVAYQCPKGVAGSEKYTNTHITKDCSGLEMANERCAYILTTPPWFTATVSTSTHTQTHTYIRR